MNTYSPYETANEADPPQSPNLGSVSLFLPWLALFMPAGLLYFRTGPVVITALSFFTRTLRGTVRAAGTSSGPGESFG